MGILSKLKAMLGFGDDGSSSRNRDGDVTVEHEPDTETETAVKGTDNGVDEPVATETDAAGSTASITEEPPEVPGDDEVAAAAEPAEAAGPESQVEEPAPDDSDAEAAPSADAPDVEDTDADVETISGIGPTYAARLGSAGVETVGDLLAGDATVIAEDSDISQTRIERWQERAREP